MYSMRVAEKLTGFFLDIGHRPEYIPKSSDFSRQECWFAIPLHGGKMENDLSLDPDHLHNARLQSSPAVH
jgi:hypothetical protein